MTQSLRSLVVLSVLFIAIWTPRIAGLDQTVTVDERKWLVRSGNFFQAITHGEWDATFQKGHPGVTIMWAGALGFRQLIPDYAQAVPSAHWEEAQLESWLRQTGVATALALLVAGRWWVVLMITLLITASYFPLRRLFGGKLAFLLVLFVAWNPFYLALSRQLHPDGLVANFIYLAWLYLLAWFYAGQARSMLILAGIGMGLAWATKAPAILLLPAGGLLFALEMIRAYRALAPVAGRAALLAVGKRFLPSAFLWGGLALLTFVAIWPAMWVQPLGTLRQMALEMLGYLDGHVSVNYFWGKTVHDPGYLFYPTAYLLRATPATLIGLAIAGFLAWRRGWPFDQPQFRRWTGALILLILTFAIGMTLGAKKFDRYLLPLFPLLDLVALLGWVGLANVGVAWWRQRRGRQPESYPSAGRAGIAGQQGTVVFAPVLVAGLTVTLFGHGLFGFAHYPYYLTYYNPLFGGGATAPVVLMVGWGEGLDAAAAWLNQQPNAAQLRVASTYGDGPLSYFLQSERPVLSFWTPDFWFDADYAVLYVNQWQRRSIIPEIVDYFAAQSPVHVVEAHGIELARIYDLRGRTPPDFAGVYTESAANLDNYLYLAAYSMGAHTFLSGDRFIIRLYWKKLAPLTHPYVAIVQLVAPDGQVMRQSQRELITVEGDDWPRDGVYYDEHELTIPALAPSGVYTIQVALTDTVELGPLQIINTNWQVDQRQMGHHVTTLTVQAATRYKANVQWDGLQLTTRQHKPTTKPGETLWVDMTMTGNIDENRKLSTRLVNPVGVTMAQTDKSVATTMRFDLLLPTEAITGVYELVAVLYDAQTLAPFPDTKGEFETVLTTIDVMN